MKRTLFSFVLLAGMLGGFAGAAHAEMVEGVITSIDSEKNLLTIAPSGTEDPAAGVSVSVLDFIRANGSAELNVLDVGKNVSMAVRKGTSGNLELVSLEKPELLVPAASEEDKYVKATDKKKHAPVREMKKIVSPAEMGTPQ